jgi:hypothetical protein
MSDRIVVDDGAETGVKEIAHFDPTTGDLLALERVEDVEAVLEWCKGRYNEGLVNRHSEFRQVGSYPANVISIFEKKHGLKPGEAAIALGKDKHLTNKLLNDPDLSGFRTLAGRY